MAFWRRLRRKDSNELRNLEKMYKDKRKIIPERFRRDFPEISSLMPGDIILAHSKKSVFGKLISLFTKSKFTHAALYLGNGLIVESDKELRGVVVSPLVSYYDYKKHKLKAFRPKFLSEGKAMEIAEDVFGKVGSPYDFRQIVGHAYRKISSLIGVVREVPDAKNSFICTELIAKAFEKSTGKRFHPEIDAKNLTPADLDKFFEASPDSFGRVY